jgi:hypothetical protein
MSENGVDRLDVLDTAEHAQLEGGNRHVFQYRACLGDDMGGIKDNKINNIPCILHGYRGDDRGGMAPLACQRFDIGLNAGAATRVVAGKGHHNGNPAHVTRLVRKPRISKAADVP